MKLLTLSTGDEVSMRDKFTHADELVYSAGRRKGVFERRFTDDKGKIVIERTPDNLDAAFEDTLMALIEKVNGAEGERSATREWLGSLSEPDYESLAAALVDIRQTCREAVEAGKKNR
jgi:hypothetical protein